MTTQPNLVVQALETSVIRSLTSQRVMSSKRDKSWRAWILRLLNPTWINCKRKLTPLTLKQGDWRRNSEIANSNCAQMPIPERRNSCRASSLSKGRPIMLLKSKPSNNRSSVHEAELSTNLQEEAVLKKRLEGISSYRRHALDLV